MLALLKLRDGQGVDPVVFGMRSDEFDKCDAPAEVESNDHPKVASGDFESRRSPFRIFAFGAAERTSSIEFHLALLTNVLQRCSGIFVSECPSA
jgi:hypothetical protein